MFVHVVLYLCFFLHADHTVLSAGHFPCKAVGFLFSRMWIGIWFVVATLTLASYDLIDQESIPIFERIL